MIKFYKTIGTYGCFSNFSRHPVFIWGYHFMTSEHAYQAAKMLEQDPSEYDFPYGEHFDIVRTAKSPSQAAKLGRRKDFPMRKDWDYEHNEFQKVILPNYGLNHKHEEYSLWRVKDFIMYDVCLAKFKQNKDAKKTLLDTKNEIIVEDTSMSHDHYWGLDFSNKYKPIGENKLGRVLMLVRNELHRLEGLTE